MTDDNTPESKPLAPVKLTPDQARKWAETRTATLWSQPAFSDIWYNLMVGDDGQQAYFTNDPALTGGVAAVDGKSMYIAPDGFFDPKYNLNHRVFIACHEIMHCVYDDVGWMYRHRELGKVTFPDGKSAPYDQQLANMAADYRINDLLHESKVGEIPQDALHDPNLISHKDTLLEAYRKLYQDEERKGGGKGKPNPSGGPSGSNGKSPGGGAGKSFDKHLQPGQGKGQKPADAQAQRNDQQWATAVAGALASAKAQGKLPAALERALGKVLEPEVDWTEKLRTQLSRRIGNSGSSWRTLDAELMQRGIGAPGRVAFGAETIIVAVDTSGSISQSMLDRFMSETGGILDDVRPRRLVVIQCDAKIHEVVECDDTADLRRKIKGGGGTDFRPVFQHIEKEGYTMDALIYFTDTYGSFPDQAPGYPVIWASVEKGAKVPWGDYIDVPLKGA